MELGGFIIAAFLSPPVLTILAVIAVFIIGVVTVIRADLERKRKEEMEESRRAGLKEVWKK